MLLSIQHSKQNGLKLDAAYACVHIFLKFSRTLWWIGLGVGWVFWLVVLVLFLCVGGLFCLGFFTEK